MKILWSALLHRATIKKRRHSGAEWCDRRCPKKIIGPTFAVFVWKCWMTDCCRVWLMTTVSYCDPLKAELCCQVDIWKPTFDSRMHPVNADCNCGRPETPYTVTQSSPAYVEATPLVHFYTKTAFMEMTRHTICSGYRNWGFREISMLYC